MRAGLVALGGALAALAGAAVGVACSTGDILSSVGSFPCAKDGTCPDGYSCEGDAGCFSVGGSNGQALGLDGVCGGFNGNCQSGLCTYGVCGGAPQNLYTCTGDHPVFVDGACLRSCSASSPCPTPLACAWLPTGQNGALAQVCAEAAQVAIQDTLCDQPGYTCPVNASDNTSPYACVANLCELLNCAPADAGPQCPPGHTCAVYDDSEDQACLPNCGSPACVSPTTCNGTVCLGPD